METLADLRPGTTAVVGELELNQRDAVRLMELGFIPGMPVSCQRRVPMGDLAVYQLDGSQIALRYETASQIRIQSESAGEAANASRD